MELHAHDVVNKTDHTLLQKLDSYNFSFEISPDSAWVAVQRMQAGKQTLDIVSIDGAEFYPIYPQPGITQPHAFEFIKFLPAAEGDSGSLLFSAQTLDSPKIFIASLADFMTVREVKTGEVVGEKLGAFQVTANGQSLVYQIKVTSNSDSNRGRTYSLNLANLEATPVFLFESEFTSSKLMADSSAIIYVSSGGFYAKNSILLTTLNGASTSPLSVNFPADWIKAEETIQRLESAGSYVLFTTNTPNSFPLEYKLHSFKR